MNTDREKALHEALIATCVKTAQDAVAAGRDRESFLLGAQAAIEACTAAMRATQPAERAAEPVAWLRADGMKAMPDDERQAWIEAGNADVVAEYTIPLARIQHGAVMNKDEPQGVTARRCWLNGGDCIPGRCEEPRYCARNDTVAGVTAQPALTDERKAAEQEYTVTAFDYVRNPVGSPDWCMYWKGWQARAAPVEAAAPPEPCMETLLAVAAYLGIDADAEEARPGYDPKGPVSKTLIAAIERRVKAAAPASTPEPVAEIRDTFGQSDGTGWIAHASLKLTPDFKPRVGTKLYAAALDSGLRDALTGLECANQFAAKRGMAVTREWVRGWDACTDYVRAALSRTAP
jgi:hypothetical protein